MRAEHGLDGGVAGGPRVRHGDTGEPAGGPRVRHGPDDPPDLGPQPANVRVERFVPQAELLARCAVAVTHAGAGSVAGALAHGVPLVCVPIGADQPLNAARCVALGAGLALDPLALTLA